MKIIEREEAEMSFLPMLVAAMILVESGGDPAAVGDGGRALGVLQIHRGVVADVNRRYRTAFRWEDAKNPDLAKEICELYLRAWAPADATPEQCARIWNGGPRGHLKAGTETYWKKVEAIINEREERRGGVERSRE